MASRAVQQEKPRGGVPQKDGAKERRTRRVLGDIGNLGAKAKAVEGKPPNQINRPNTRSFCAQLLANAQEAAEKKKKQGEQVVDLRPGPSRSKKEEEQKPDQVVLISPDSSHGKGSKKKKKKVGPTLTSVLAARSKEVCGITKKLEELIVNIDEASEEDHLAVAEYVEDIYTFYKLTEEESQVQDYMGTQPDINAKMRSILIDWLIEVHHRFELRPETLYLTVNVIDRFLSSTPVPRKELQLVGISSMLVASKYEEIWAPQVNDFVCISDKAYVGEQVRAMEKAILGKLGWHLTVPTPYMFLTRYAKASLPSDTETESMVFFFAELGIGDYSIITSFGPSVIAASSVYAARCTLEKSPSWTETLRHYTGHSEGELKKCAKVLASLHSVAPESKLKAVYRKYSKPDLSAVALRSPAKSLLA